MANYVKTRKMTATAYLGIWFVFEALLAGWRTLCARCPCALVLPALLGRPDALAQALACAASLKMTGHSTTQRSRPTHAGCEG